MVQGVMEGHASSGDNQDFWYLLYTCHHRVCSVSLLKDYPGTWKKSRQGFLPQSVGDTIPYKVQRGVCESEAINAWHLDSVQHCLWYKIGLLPLEIVFITFPFTQPRYLVVIMGFIAPGQDTLEQLRDQAIGESVSPDSHPTSSAIPLLLYESLLMCSRP